LMCCAPIVPPMHREERFGRHGAARRGRGWVVSGLLLNALYEEGGMMAPGNAERRKVQKFTVPTTGNPQGETHYGYELVKIVGGQGNPGNMKGGYLITQTAKGGQANAQRQAVSAVFVREKPGSGTSNEEMHQLIVAVNDRSKGVLCWTRSNPNDPVVRVDGRHRFYAVPETKATGPKPVPPVGLEAVANAGFALDPTTAWRAWVYKQVNGVWAWNHDLTVLTMNGTTCNVTVKHDTWVAAYFS